MVHNWEGVHKGEPWDTRRSGLGDSRQQGVSQGGRVDVRRRTGEATRITPDAVWLASETTRVSGRAS